MENCIIWQLDMLSFNGPPQPKHILSFAYHFENQETKCATWNKSCLHQNTTQTHVFRHHAAQPHRYSHMNRHNDTMTEKQTHLTFVRHCKFQGPLLCCFSVSWAAGWAVFLHFICKCKFQSALFCCFPVRGLSGVIRHCKFQSPFSCCFSGRCAAGFESPLFCCFAVRWTAGLVVFFRNSFYSFLLLLTSLGLWLSFSSGVCLPLQVPISTLYCFSLLWAADLLVFLTFIRQCKFQSQFLCCFSVRWGAGLVVCLKLVRHCKFQSLLFCCLSTNCAAGLNVCLLCIRQCKFQSSLCCCFPVRWAAGLVVCLEFARQCKFQSPLVCCFPVR